MILVMLAAILAGCADDKSYSESEMPQAASADSGVSQEGINPVGGDAEMPKVLFIVAQNRFRDEELAEPKRILEQAGYKCEVASITTATARGMLGLEVKPDLAVKDAKADDYGLIVVVGGAGSPELANHPEVLKLLADANRAGKKLGAICIGPMILAKAGVLEDRQATVFETPESRAALELGGAILVKQSVVADGNIVTANGPAAAKEFGRRLVELLKKG